MLGKLEALNQEAQAALTSIDDSGALREWELKYLGKKGAVTEIMRSVGSLPKEERADFGKRANEIKGELTEAFALREEAVKAQELARDLQSGAVDVTLPGRPQSVGGLHPSTQMLRKFYDIWADMGFQVYRSRDVEDDDTNFTLLNIPPHHPARDMWDTFHTTKPGVILRTHTSPGQIRSMREYGGNGTLPIRVILPGMCYRYEQTSVRSEIQFNQVEGVCIGKNIHLTDLKGTVSEFARRMFSADTKVRFRSSYFPFTEPSMEVDAECLICHGEGCAMCKYSGWLEIAGCGMMHPVVLRNGGYDPAVWSGFAFGMGPERMINLKFGVADIRYYWGNDLRFLEQF
ncbi:MAG TPA: phenylalanine--tRNA ligase subunit alpha [Phototrophicaceae bacterium]|nr:phenylalanine--tRNA ligase subunit alpha [Phototrophicaceae bacterium]